MTNRALPPVSFLGVGSMNGAILAGVVKSGAVEGAIVTTNRSASKAAAIRDDYGDRVTALAEESTPDANAVAVQNAEIVVLGVKPYQVEAVLSQVSGNLATGAIVVSVAAGTTLRTMRVALGARDDVRLVRVMPNTPAFVGAGVTGVATEDNLSDTDYKLVEELFMTVGQVVRVSESQLDKLSTISGSGPAYFYFFTEALTAAAETMGFDHDTARLLAESTFAGSGLLMRESGEEPAELRRQVTSPGGTTAEAIASFAADGLDQMVAKATAAALRRSEEIAAGK